MTAHAELPAPFCPTELRAVQCGRSRVVYRVPLGTRHHGRVVALGLAVAFRAHDAPRHRRLSRLGDGYTELALASAPLVDADPPETEPTALQRVVIDRDLWPQLPRVERAMLMDYYDFMRGPGCYWQTPPLAVGQVQVVVDVLGHLGVRFELEPEGGDRG